MRRHRWRLIGVDVLAAFVATWLAFALRFGISTWANETVSHLGAACAGMLTWSAILFSNRAYEVREVGAPHVETQRVFRSFLHLTAFVALVSFAAKADLARGFVVLALLLAVALTLLGRCALRMRLHRARARGRATHRVLAVGDVTAITAFRRGLTRDPHPDMQVVGACVTRGAGTAGRDGSVSDVPVVPDVDTVVDSAKELGADTVAVLTSGDVGSERLRWIAWQLEGTDIGLVISPGIAEVAGRRLHIRPVADLTLLHVEEPEFRGLRRLLKGSFDRAVAAFAVVLLLPLFAVIALAVRVTSPGPAFFTQVRVGRDGKHFRMVKFRSMYADAERRLVELVSQNDHGGGPLFKMRADPRVTRIGRVLRRYSLDELPQLFNVLCGQMSLVGPRPPLPSEVQQYEDDVRRRLLVKPGLTGLWQVSGRSNLSWEDSVRLDLRYVENWSPALDLLILWKTVFAVLRGSGAY